MCLLTKFTKSSAKVSGMDKNILNQRLQNDLKDQDLLRDQEQQPPPPYSENPNTAQFAASSSSHTKTPSDQKPSIQSPRKFDVTYTNWKQTHVEFLSESGSVTYTADTSWGNSNVVLKSASSPVESQIASSKCLGFRRPRMEVNIHGATITIGTNGLVSGKSFDYSSPALGGRSVTWTSGRCFQHFDFQSRSEDGEASAVFTRSGWKHVKKIGSVEVVDGNGGDAFTEEVLAVGLGIYQFMVMHNAAIAAAVS